MGVPGNADLLLLKQAAAAGRYQVQRSIRYNASDSAFLSRTPASAGNRKTWTWSGWVKLGSVGTSNFVLFNAENGTSTGFANNLWLYLTSNQLYVGDGASDYLVSNNKFRDPSAWYHIVLSVDTTQSTASNKMKLHVNGSEITYATDGRSSITTNSDTSVSSTFTHYIGRSGLNLGYFDGYLADIYFIDGQALTPSSFGEFDATTGVWNPKTPTGLSYGTNGYHLDFADNSNNTATTLGKDTSGNGNNWTPNNLSVNSGSVASPVRFAWSTTGSGWTLSNSNYTASYTRTTTYTQAYSAALDGSTTYRFYLRQSPGDNIGGWFFAATNSVSSTHPDELGGNSLGMRNGESTIGTYGTFATANGTSSGQDQITGLSSITASSGSTTYSEWVVNMTARKVWVRSASDSTWLKGGDPSNSSSTPTFYLASGTVYFGYVGYDGTGISSFDTSVPSIAAGNDSLVDSPTNGTASSGGDVGGVVVGNYCTWNSLAYTSGLGTYSNGNLQLATSLSGYPIYTATQYTPAGTGKWYWEFTLDVQTGTNYTMLGMLPADSQYAGQNGTPYSYGGLATYIGFNGVNNAASGAATASGTATATITVGDTVGWAFDAANGTVVIYKNGVSQGTCYTNVRTNVGWTLAFSDYDNSSSSTVTVNFGQRPFAYAAPSGFKSLNTANLPTPTILKGSSYFDTKLYTGNGSTQTISGLGFSPDFVWIKARSNTGSHALYDTIRGNNIRLRSDTTDGDQTLNSIQFQSTGFDLSTDLNTNAYTYAAWCWDAGSSNSTNTQGSITSTVRANASAGFSVVTYTSNGTNGATVGHGLGVAPQFVIVKNRLNATNWMVGHQSLDPTSPWNYYLRLNGTIASAAAADFWNNTAPTSSVVTLGTSTSVNSIDGDTYVMYAFAPVSGYSSFGSYTGNGSSDGPFVYTGFRPRWVMVKRTDTGNSNTNWAIYDSARSDNPNTKYLLANTSGAEGNYYDVDFLSNGFKLRLSGDTTNQTSGTYIYAAFAENPFSIARAR